MAFFEKKIKLSDEEMKKLNIELTKKHPYEDIDEPLLDPKNWITSTTPKWAPIVASQAKSRSVRNGTPITFIPTSSLGSINTGWPTTTPQSNYLETTRVKSQLQKLYYEKKTPWIVDLDLPRMCGKSTLLYSLAHEYHESGADYIFLTGYTNSLYRGNYKIFNFNRDTKEWFRSRGWNYSVILFDEVAYEDNDIYDFIMNKYDEKTTFISLGST